MKVIEKMKNKRLTKRRFVGLTILLLTLIISACSSKSTDEDNNKIDEQLVVEIDETRIATLQRSCMSCHGVDLSGVPGDGPSLNNIGSRLSKEELTEILKNGTGNGRMPKGLLEGGISKEGDLEMMVEWLSQKKYTEN
jgi:cytochrome c5